MHRGVFINLDSASRRRQSIEESLREAGFASNDYLRIPGFLPTGNEIQLNKGLSSPGELGIWHSILNALSTISCESFEPIVHFMEDDISFSNKFKETIDLLKSQLAGNATLSEIDIVFLDYFMSRSLFESVYRRSIKSDTGQFDLFPTRGNYMACCNSFLIRKSSAPYIHGILSKILRSADEIMPVDLALRELLNQGVIKGAMLRPTLNAPSWELDNLSSIQDNLNTELRTSQRAHILLRILAAKLESPYWCAKQLTDILGLKFDIDSEISVEKFLELWDSTAKDLIGF